MHAAQSMAAWCVVMCAATTAQAAGEGRFGWLGLGPTKAGQTLAQTEAALGAPLQIAPPVPKDSNACHTRSAASQPGVAYIVNQGVVTRMETRDKRYLTVAGVRVGDEVKRVRQIYGQRLSVAPHVYFAGGLMLTVYSPNRKFALVMESNDSGRIVTLRGGLVPAVEFLEGCSA